MGLSRHEVNLRRLLVKCELMIKNNQKDDQRFPKYISSLSDMLMQLKETTDSDNIYDYTRRIDSLKRLIFNETDIKSNSSKDNLTTDVDSNLDISPSKNSSRAELLGTNSTLRSRKAKGTDDLDEILEYHQNMQEKIADDMLLLTRNLKEQSELANRIIKADTETATKSTTLTERNFSKLKVESEKLAEHSRRACKCWMWVMLIIVMVLFISSSSETPINKFKFILTISLLLTGNTIYILNN